jgi:hypothetical protein
VRLDTNTAKPSKHAAVAAMMTTINTTALLPVVQLDQMRVFGRCWVRQAIKVVKGIQKSHVGQK